MTDGNGRQPCRKLVIRPEQVAQILVRPLSLDQWKNQGRTNACFYRNRRNRVPTYIGTTVILFISRSSIIWHHGTTPRWTICSSGKSMPVGPGEYIDATESTNYLEELF